MTVLEQAFATARARQARVVFPELEDPRTAEAVAQLRNDGICVPVDVADITDGQIASLVANRGMKEGIARRMLARPLIRAAAMVAAGEADAMVAGATSPTAKVIEAAGLAIGLAEGVTVPSSFFLIVFPDGRQLIFADCAVNVAPDAAALAAIARASAASCEALLGPARVALLSYSTGNSGSGPSVDMIRDVAEITGFTGPIQADAALNPRTAEKKGMGAGDANVLIFPSLEAGNIAYKLVQELAGAMAIGPFLQGFRRPVCDLSRGATVADIVAATAVTIALS
ncbi:phosphate acyltransferase [Marinovum sp. 2_MG-2023]|uniref:phosphate acyltransferase n=1 Tax=Roseobacteraceae TaxID=2854170 RepID=UPI001FD04025|nr:MULTISPECIES: phosphate acyltransferase [Roseobacteraceae]MCJ7874216.1 phosphate acetyltransferase [Phaeobacter sp. J2-8]MDO6730172.1 phosphate acyltransferase [Marinovum sp. 2_MG-2023]MDO6778910.1 phosphate acyltransferase [Marinovum sp. 1_MG-2023]